MGYFSSVRTGFNFWGECDFDESLFRVFVGKRMGWDGVVSGRGIHTSTQDAGNWDWVLHFQLQDERRGKTTVWKRAYVLRMSALLPRVQVPMLKY